MSANQSYYSSSQRKWAIFGLIVFTLLFLDEAFRWGSNSVVLVAALLGAAACAYSFLRLAFSKVDAFEKGIHVTNIFSSFDLAWDQIDQFSIGRWSLLPYVCLIHLSDGEMLHATGIEESTNFANGSAQTIVDELNRELVERLPDRLQRSPTDSGLGAAQSELFRQS